jgi:hypothetical protein
MSLTYDFDIFDVIPTDGEDDPTLGRFMSEIGFGPDQQSKKVALFRYQGTADALRDAPDVLRDFFVASGFGLNTYHSGAPDGYYPAKDEDARLDIIRQLTENAEVYDLPNIAEHGEDGQGFVLGDFLTALAHAQPIEMPKEERPPEPYFVSSPPMVQGPAPEVDLALIAEMVEESNATTPHDLRHPHEVRPKSMPPMFDTAPAEAAPARKKFWQGKFFFRSLSFGAMLAAVQITTGFGHLV